LTQIGMVRRKPVAPWITILGDPGQMSPGAERSSDQVSSDGIRGRVDRVEGLACERAKAGSDRAGIPPDLRIGVEEIAMRGRSEHAPKPRAHIGKRRAARRVCARDDTSDLAELERAGPHDVVLRI